MLQRGDTFGAYRIVARLKAGGMAQLYLARREGAAGFKRPVALKVIHPHLASEQEFVSMFVDEATLSSKIHDPNVVHVEDLGHANGGLFLAMEYVHGAALANVLRAARKRDRRLAPALVAHIAAHIASGLHAAHEVTDDSGALLGIVHRDVSPQNVLIAFKGHVKVIDFGIAKALANAHTSADDAITGKLAYMPPEQARGQTMDRRADVYALGIVTWEMLAGRRLFEADNDLALIAQVREPKIDPPSRYVSDLPRALDEVVMAMLAREASARPATALDVKRMLLDAVPEARSVEAHDVAALLRALLPEQIAAQDKLLASAELGSEERGSPRASTPSPGPPPEDGGLTEWNPALADTERMVEPADAFHQLTVPAVVVPAIHPHGGPPSEPGLRASSAASAPRASLSTTALVALVAVVLLAIGGGGFAVKRLRAPRASDDAARTPVAAAPPSAAVPAPLSEPAATSESSAASPPPSSSVRAALAPSERPRPAKPAGKPPRPAAPAAGPPKPHCRVVGGVELCE